MATSPTAICNRALSEIGTQSTITSLSEASAEAVQCQLWYDKLRRQLLRAAPWGFAREQQVLTELGTLADLTAPYPYLYKYAYPAETIKFRYILAAPVVIPAEDVPDVSSSPLSPLWCGPSRSNRFLIANDRDSDGNSRKVLLSNVASAIGVYTGDITDPSLFDDLFEDALTAALAYRLVIPLSGNTGMKADFRQEAEDAITRARAIDGNEAIPSTDHVVDWMATRGVGGYYGNPLGGGVFSGSGWGQWNVGWDNMSWGM